MKRLLSVQDISCVGKCSLTVALPIISAMGIEACPLPTALLSTQTAFDHFSFRDLTDEIPAIEKVWEEEGIRFDTIQSGYLGSVRQIAIVKDLYRNFGKSQRDLPANGVFSCLRIVDPAMADEGKLYKGFSPDFVEAMKSLCAEADVVVPNVTEACLLTGMDYREDLSEEDYRELLKKLADLGCRQVVLTGFQVESKESPHIRRMGAASYDRDTGEFKCYVNEKLPVQYHGTGDIFASVLAGALTLGWTIGNAIQLAVDFTLESIRKSLSDPDAVTYGVNFEQAIPMLTKELF